MRIGIIGAGRMGRTLAWRWAERGHRIYLGVRAPVEPPAPGVTILDPYDAAGADVVVLAVPAKVAPKVAFDLDDLEGRILIDCTQPPHPQAVSVAERIAQQCTGARVVKALNLLDARTLALPGLADERPMLPLCGDDDDARAVVSELAWSLGTAPVELAGLHHAGMVESLGALRRTLSARGHGPYLALQVKDLEQELIHLPGQRRQVGEQRWRVR